MHRARTTFLQTTSNTLSNPRHNAEGLLGGCRGDGSPEERFREAIKSGDLSIVTDLIEGIDLNAPDKLGNTSLHQVRSAAVFLRLRHSLIPRVT